MLGHLPDIYNQIYHALHWWEPGLFALLVFFVPMIVLWPFNKFNWYGDMDVILLYHSALAFPVFYLMYFSLDTAWMEDIELLFVGLYLLGAVLAGCIVLLILLLELEEKIFTPPWEKEQKHKEKLEREEQKAMENRYQLRVVSGGVKGVKFLRNRREE